MTDTALYSLNLGPYRSQCPDRPFECASCDGHFRFVSGLLQHVESDKCEERLGCAGLLDCFMGELARKVGRRY